MEDDGFQTPPLQFQLLPPKCPNAPRKEKRNKFYTQIKKKRIYKARHLSPCIPNDFNIKPRKLILNK